MKFKKEGLAGQLKRVAAFSLATGFFSAAFLALLGLYFDGAALFLGVIGGVLALIHLYREVVGGKVRVGNVKSSLVRMIIRALPLTVAGLLSPQSLPYALGGLLIPNLMLVFVR
ncbi:MAG: hypothetical protein C0609_01370 [Deltaproteobacteria bacterium]|nr:MAG: hypothetical protein C0609_01370 [Deltaproteobacteria bacterium]